MALQVALGLNMSRTNSDVSSTTYNNSTIIAENGSIKINSLGTKDAEGNQVGGDTTIMGANILAQNITLNTQGDLNIESRQNYYKDKTKSFGVSLGGGGSSGGGANGVNFGVNYSSSKTDRLWVDNQTSIIGTDSVTINTGNNTNIKGALLANIANATSLREAAGDVAIQYEGGEEIDGGNLTLNTKTLTFSNLFDHEYSQSQGYGFSTNIGKGSSNSTNQGTASSSNPNQQNSFYPNGSTTISLNNSGYKKEQTTKATIGLGNITTGSTQVFDNSDSSSSTYGDLATSTGGTTNDITTLTNLNRGITNTQEITKDTITNALNISVTFDNRLLSSAGRTQIAQEMGSLPENLKTTTKMQALLIDEAIELVGKTPVVGGVIRNTITSPVEGFIDYFYENDSNVVDKSGNVVSATAKTNYLVNGVGNDEESVKELLNEKDVDAVARVNPTSGILGDLVESGLGKTLGRWFSGSSAMAVLVAGDINERKDMTKGNSVFHSQGSIIGDNAVRYYNQNYDVTGVDKINSGQMFIAVGPAVGENIWYNTVATQLNLSVKDNAFYNHDPNDPVKYLTSPGNLINDLTNPVQQAVFGKQNMSPYILPNLYDTAKGLFYGVVSPSAHVLKNEEYIKYLKTKQPE